MTDPRRQLLDWIDEDRDRLIAFYSGFLKAKSPNPPGDTRLAAEHITGYLDGAGLPYRIVAPQESMPNILGSFDGAAPGRHLVLNGHIDVFPEQEPLPGERDQWSGDVEDGRIYGRGAADMKCGTSASIFTYAYLHRLKEHLKGRLTLTAVSDEETGGRWGTRYLMENFPDEVKGDCCLNGEPSGVHTIRFGEKGTLRLTFTARTRGAHGAYPHLSESATKIIARLAVELETLEALEPDVPEHIRQALAGPGVAEAFDASLGEGASAVANTVTVNIGVLKGGVKVNVLPDTCEMQVDIRMPIGIDKPRIVAAIDAIMVRYPQVTMAEHVYHSYPSSACDPAGEMVTILQNNVESLIGIRPPAIVSLGGSDGRYWRWAGVNCYLYGPSPKTMGQRGEHVEVEEFLHIVRTHALSALDYLMVPA